jgi:hypothetical protein
MNSFIARSSATVYINDGSNPSCSGETFLDNPSNTTFIAPALGKLVTEKPVYFVDFDSVVKFNKNRQNDDNVVKAYKS